MSPKRQGQGHASAVLTLENVRKFRRGVIPKVILPNPLKNRVPCPSTGTGDIDSAGIRAREAALPYRLTRDEWHRAVTAGWLGRTATGAARLGLVAAWKGSLDAVRQTAAAGSGR